MIQNIYIYAFSHSFPLWSITGYWIQGLVVYPVCIWVCHNYVSQFLRALFLFHNILFSFFHFLKSFIEVSLIYNVVLISAVQQSDSVIHIHISIFCCCCCCCFLGPLRIRATSATYTTAQSYAGSLTHWVRPGIEPASSWILLGFVNRWAMKGTPYTDSL